MTTIDVGSKGFYKVGIIACSLRRVFDYSPEFDVLDGIGSRLVPFRLVLRVYERVELNDALGMTLRRVLFKDVFRTIFGERHWSSSSKRTTRGHETVDGLVITTTYVHDATLIFGRHQSDGIIKKKLIITTGRDVVYGGGKKNKLYQISICTDRLSRGPRRLLLPGRRRRHSVLLGKIF